MKQYKSYLSDIEWHGISNRIDNAVKGGVKSKIVLYDMIKYQDLSEIRNEIWWYLVDKDLLEENKKLNNILKELTKYIIDRSEHSWDDNGAYDDVLDKLEELRGVINNESK